MPVAADAGLWLAATGVAPGAAARRAPRTGAASSLALVCAGSQADVLAL